jgi:hypothetical protein
MADAARGGGSGAAFHLTRVKTATIDLKLCMTVILSSSITIIPYTRRCCYDVSSWLSLWFLLMIGYIVKNHPGGKPPMGLSKVKIADPDG